MASFEKLMTSTDKKLDKRASAFKKRVAKVTKPKKAARKTKGKWDEFDEK